MSYLPKPQQSQDNQSRPHEPRGLGAMHVTGTLLAQTVKLVLCLSVNQRPEVLKVFINRKNAIIAFLPQQVLLIISYCQFIVLS